MNMSPCDQLDGYLANWLSERQRAAFKSHLADCHACRSQIELQSRIDRLLVEGVEQLGSASPSLIDSIEGRIQSLHRRRTVRLAAGLAPAASVALLVGVWSAIQEPTRRLPESQPIAKKQAKPVRPREDGVLPVPLARQTESLVRVTASDPSAAILVPVETEHPNVSIVWVYSTMIPASFGNDADAN
ncbi:MAG: anti-sigma factor [Pirellulales bacterium]